MVVLMGTPVRRNVRFGAVADIRDTWLPPSGALSALGQERPVVRMWDFFDFLFCYARARGPALQKGQEADFSR